MEDARQRFKHAQAAATGNIEKAAEPRKRGRPREAEAKPPKKRGRPRKAEAAEPRKRGRPRKASKPENS